MRTLLTSALALCFPGISIAASMEDYSTTCRVSGGQASASITSQHSDVSLRGTIRISALDRNHRTIEEYVINTDVESRRTNITRLGAVDVAAQAMSCRVDTSDARIWVDGMLVQDFAPHSTVVEHHHHVYPQPQPRVVREVHFNSVGGSSYHHYREPSRVVVIEKQRPRRAQRVERVIIQEREPRRVERVIIRPEPTRPPRQTKIEVELPFIRVRS